MDAYAYLLKDKRLGPIVRQIGPLKLKQHHHPWLYLTYSIMSQQLSVSVAQTLRNRLDHLMGEHPEPETIVSMPFDLLKGIGLSHAKTTYIKSVSAFAVSQSLSYATLQEMDDDTVIKYLTQIKGVGRWTAEMVLMFSLGRPDVFPIDDLGIRYAMQELFRFRKSSAAALRAKMDLRSRQWAPYRTYAAMYLWRRRDA